MRPTLYQHTSARANYSSFYGNLVWCVGWCDSWERRKGGAMVPLKPCGRSLGSINRLDTPEITVYNLAKAGLTPLRIFLNLSNTVVYMFKLWRIRLLRALLLARLPLFLFSSSPTFARLYGNPFANLSDEYLCVPGISHRSRPPWLGYNRGTGKYTPLANIQFAVDWSDLSNPGLRANQWGLYICWGCNSGWTVLLQVAYLILIVTRWCSVILHRPCACSLTIAAPCLRFCREIATQLSTRAMRHLQSPHTLLSATRQWKHFSSPPTQFFSRINCDNNLQCPRRHIQNTALKRALDVGLWIGIALVVLFRVRELLFFSPHKLLFSSGFTNLRCQG